MLSSYDMPGALELDTGIRSRHQTLKHIGNRASFTFSSHCNLIACPTTNNVNLPLSPMDISFSTEYIALLVLKDNEKQELFSFNRYYWSTLITVTRI